MDLLDLLSKSVEFLELRFTASEVNLAFQIGKIWEYERVWLAYFFGLLELDFSTLCGASVAAFSWRGGEGGYGQISAFQSCDVV